MTFWEQDLEGWRTRGLPEGREELNEMECPQDECCHCLPHLGVSSPQRGSPPSHRPDQQQLQLSFQARPRLGCFPLGPAGGCLHLWEQNTSAGGSPKPEVSFCSFDPPQCARPPYWSLSYFQSGGAWTSTERTIVAQRGHDRTKPQEQPLTSLRRGVTECTAVCGH